MELKDIEKLLLSAINENNSSSPDIKSINSNMQEAIELVRDLIEDDEEIEKCD